MKPTEGDMPSWCMLLARYEAAGFFQNEKEFKKAAGQSATVNARLMKYGRVLRPVFGINKYTTPNTVLPAQISVDYQPERLLRVSLAFDLNIAEYIGRPVIGDCSGGHLEQKFGDIETVDSGIQTINAFVYEDGFALMAVERIRGGNGILTGVTVDEVKLFCNSNVAFLNYHLAKERQAA